MKIENKEKPYLIKMRAWIAEDNQMVYSVDRMSQDIKFSVEKGIVACLKNYRSIDGFSKSQDDWEPTGIIMLGLGKSDKNGKEIYDGDIIKFNDDDVISVVRYDIEKAMFVIDDYGYTGATMEYGWDEDAGEFDVVDTNTFDSFNDMSNIEIIGNIYENPELLNG